MSTDVVRLMPSLPNDLLVLRDSVLPRQERELIASILRHVEGAGSLNAAQRRDVEAAIARGVGEIVLCRTFEDVGGRVVEELKLGRATSLVNVPPGPHPPSPAPGPGPGAHLSGPHPPSPAPGPGPKLSASGEERSERSIAALGPHPPSPAPGPGPRAQPIQVAAASVAVLDSPEILPANYVLLDEFLVPEELEALSRYTTVHEPDFRLSEVVSPGVAAGVIDHEYRRSRVLMDLGPHEEVLLSRIRWALPRILPRLGLKPFSISRTEAQITASNDGDFFREHSDNGQPEIATRELTFVYFFHREPRAFAGGELRIYESRRNGNGWVRGESCATITPEQNQIVFFPSQLVHEITPVACPSRTFADSRFTVNGWFHK